jgi:hypothetical protein
MEIRGLDILLGSLATKMSLSLLVVRIGFSTGLKSQALLQDLLNERIIQQALSALQLFSQGPVRLFDLLDVDLLGLKRGGLARGGRAYLVHGVEPLLHEGLAGGALPVELAQEPALTQELGLLDDVLYETICELLVEGVES